jgi:hypothetical protein
MKSTHQPMPALLGIPVHGLTRALVTASAVVLIVVLVVALGIAGSAAIGTTGISADRAGNDSLMQFRRDEVRERYAPSVEEVRQSLMQFRQDEREERWER